MTANRLHLAPALEPAWQQVLDARARDQGWITTANVRELGALVHHLSSFYNSVEGQPPPSQRRHFLPARLLFSFARDVPKTGAALAELLVVDSTFLTQKPLLRILDLGAGLGASTVGILRALHVAGSTADLHVTLVDIDADVLGLATSLLRSAAESYGGTLTMTAVRALSVEAGLRELSGETFDVVVLANVLSELDPDVPPALRQQRHADLLDACRQRLLSVGGVLLVVEPALRSRTRHLQQVRDELQARGAVIFAPCLHDGRCPLLQNPTDWCHEDLPRDLPPWLVPIARAAGLRYQGLTFSYLVVRHLGPTLRACLPSVPMPLRVVAAPRVTKGKQELLLCGQFPSASAAAHWIGRLDRHRNAAAHHGWDTAQRGDLLTFDPLPGEVTARVAVTTIVQSPSAALPPHDPDGFGGGKASRVRPRP